MANFMYDKARQAFLDADIDWSADDIRAILVDTALYTPVQATDTFLTSIAGGARIATSGAFTGKTSTDGVADAADVTFTAVTGATTEAIVIYKHTGSDATARLILFLDTVTGIPFTPSGADIIVQWSNGADKIFKL
jgi:hypothetical protein